MDARTGAIRPSVSTERRKGSFDSKKYRFRPSAILRSVASASGRLRSKMLGTGMSQSMHSAAVWYGCGRPGPWVGFGQRMGRPSRLAIRKSRFLEVGAPKSEATRTFHATS
jgi:hypothetical protein